MEPTPLVLQEARSATLDSSGYGVVTIGPGRAGIRWEVSTLAVTTTATVSTPAAYVHLGTAAGPQLAGTWDGSNDSTELSVVLFSGQYLSIVFTGGDPGTIATVSVFGSISRVGA